MTTVFDWTPEAERQLFNLWKEGYSASVIANMMGLPSRSSAIGKLTRLGYTNAHPDAPQRTKDMIAARGSRDRSSGGGWGGKRWSGRRSTKGAGKPVTVRSLLKSGAAIFPIQMNPTSLLDLERDQCRFPLGDVNEPGTAETMFCGAKQADGSSYCQHHHERCQTPYKRPRKRRDRSKITARDRFVFGVAA